MAGKFQSTPNGSPFNREDIGNMYTPNAPNRSFRTGPPHVLRVQKIKAGFSIHGWSLETCRCRKSTHRMHSSARRSAAAVAMHGLHIRRMHSWPNMQSHKPHFIVFAKRAKQHKCVLSAIRARTKLKFLPRRANEHAMALECI